MGPYMKRFVLASLFYLGIGAVLGVLNGTTDIGYFGVYAHTHLNLLGFMSMMIFGIGYFILPRFNGRNLRFESWVPLHFWLGNLSLVGMVVFRGLEVETGASLYSSLFITSATIQFITLMMFIFNVWLTLSPVSPEAQAVPAAPQQAKPSAPVAEAKPAPQPVSQTSKQVVVNADMGVADLVDLHPSMKQLLIDEGLKPLAMPGHLDHIRQVGINLGTACQRHGMDVQRVVEKATAELARQGVQAAAPFEVGTEQNANASAISLNSLVGDVMKDYPASKAVFQKYFGAGCFECPGQAYESLDMACRMHGVDPGIFLKDLQSIQ